MSDYAYSSVRVVRETPGAPARPVIRLPSEYLLETGPDQEILSAGEYFAFIKGPRGVAEGTRIEWPEAGIRAVIHMGARLPLAGDTCDVPVTAATRREARGTLDVHTRLDEDALPVRVEHNHPDRRAGRYAEGPWVERQARACLNYIFACREILRDWGVHRQIRDEQRGTLSLMGFESNNPLHGDWPPHWHLIYYWPASEGEHRYETVGSQVPHIRLDDEGRTVSNDIFVFGRPDLGRLAGPRDPMIYVDPDGEPRLALEIRADGGLDIGPDVGRWTYSIVPGDGEGFIGSVHVLRRGERWVRVAVRDDVDRGVLTIRAEGVRGEARSAEETHLYDPLTGMLLDHNG